MSISVSIDIFSGRPNPTWTLKPSQEAEYIRHVKALPLVPIPVASELPGLGYRGLISKLSDNLLSSRSIRVFQGIVQVADNWYLDEGRLFETWLLETADSNIDVSIIEMVRREIKRQ